MQRPIPCVSHSPRLVLVVLGQGDRRQKQDIWQEQEADQPVVLRQGRQTFLALPPCPLLVAITVHRCDAIGHDGESAAHQLRDRHPGYQEQAFQGEEISRRLRDLGRQEGWRKGGEMRRTICLVRNQERARHGAARRCQVQARLPPFPPPRLNPD